jgi:metal-responsive CopG/Arc/MetJ family transcriptional regulator
METIQVVLGSKLLRATDHAARRARVNRSALVRTALREQLNHLRVREMEERDRRGYQEIAEDEAEVARWERVAEWPEP